MRWPRPIPPWRLPELEKPTSPDEESSEWLLETPQRRMAFGLVIAGVATGFVIKWQVDPDGFWDGRRPLAVLICAPPTIAIGIYMFVWNLLAWLRGDDLRDETSLIDPPV